MKAPRETTYLHRIEFAGRLSPAKRGVSIRLMRGKTVVAVEHLRGDGTFRIPVHLASPGPFHVELAEHPLAGADGAHPPAPGREAGREPRVGRPLHVVATLRPAAAGHVRVQVIRNGQVRLDQRYRARADVPVHTTTAGPLRVRVTTVPGPGYASSERTFRTTVHPPVLVVGRTDPAVTELARRLAALHYTVPSLSSTFGYDLVQSVYAFQKVQGLDRTGNVDGTFWTRLDNPRTPQPRYAQPADHIEIDKTHQVLYLVRDGKISLISPVSTAGIAGYYTPEGRFAIYRKVTGLDPSPLGVLLDPLYFVGGYAIHGNPSVPPYPASHGCVRVPNFVIYRLFSSEPYGETVYVY